MKTLTLKVILLITIALLAGCATNQFKTTMSPPSGSSIRDSKVYVYNFLDIRDSDLGSEMLSEIEKQLAQSFATHGVTIKVLKFKDSEVGRTFAGIGGGMMIPVKRTIESNLETEKLSGADYRLIVFPSKLLLQGAWKYYTIKWDLIDLKANKTIWSSTSEGKHLVMIQNDENAVERAKIIVESVIAEMKSNKLL